MKGEEVVSNNMVNMGRWRLGQNYKVRKIEEMRSKKATSN